MDYSGEYYITGVNEMGCGFKFNEDHTFEFFFSYGALDRHGYGNWSANDNNELVLNSNYRDQIPFTIEREERRNLKGLIISFPNYNKVLLNETTIKVISGGKEEEQVANRQGIFQFMCAGADKIIVTCLFYFDNPATLVPANSENNYFELQANQALPLVHFEQIKFTINGDNLLGPLHFFDETKQFTFTK